ncbi:MAG: YdcF family protein [Deltaproteobacteria bacterium]|nr:YdcF family protein [Deltaproteobacteria bacterium]MBW2192934.1 YdcF family protein [Deltaproteobacteria bacterium]
MTLKKQKVIYIGVGLLLLMTVLYAATIPAMVFIGKWIVHDDPPMKSDAVVVLNTGVELYPRLIQAADLYREGFADRVVVNGNRKTGVLIQLERKGFRPCCPWYENAVRILVLLGVPRAQVMTVDAADAYDTISEAEAVGEKIINAGMKSAIIATSKYHTRRAGFIWKSIHQNRLTVRTVAAQTDPYSPSGWWKSGRQTRWLLAEYGAWLYYYWKKFNT